MLRVLSNSIDSTDKPTDKEVAEYRRELSALLEIPKYDYIGDYDEVKGAIDILQERLKDEKSKTTRDLIKKAVEHLKVVLAHGRSPVTQRT